MVKWIQEQDSVYDGFYVELGGGKMHKEQSEILVVVKLSDNPN